ncbi:MAG: ribulose-phosphate 3-epimerase [Gemmatimonadota bacterium]|nr:ribulose-phosphate 3-epimerase [Gemmatimonadota bacterium]
MIRIAPSILSADFGRLAEQVQEVERAGADWIHVDVMDGHFVPNLTIGPLITAAVRRATALPVDVHLMIEAPERYLAAFADAGADRITVHRETCPHLHRTLEEIERLGCPAGVALNPATPLSSIGDVVGDLDLLLVMTVNPGFGGQRFIRTMLPKIREARALLREAGREGACLQVDGGIDARTAPEAVEAGADVLVAGSAVYGHAQGAPAGIAALRDALAAGRP